MAPGDPGGWRAGSPGRRAKNPRWPLRFARDDRERTRVWRGSGRPVGGGTTGPIARHIDSRAASRSPGSFVATTAALSAPEEMPQTQFGSRPASASARRTPIWYAPRAPPPWRTRMTNGVSLLPMAAGGYRERARRYRGTGLTSRKPTSETTRHWW